MFNLFLVLFVLCIIMYLFVPLPVIIIKVKVLNVLHPHDENSVYVSSWSQLSNSSEN